MDKEALRRLLKELPWGPLRDLGPSLEDETLEEYYQAISKLARQGQR